jgi:hypothetical protein
VQRAHPHALHVQFVEQGLQHRRRAVLGNQPGDQVTVAIDGITPSLHANQDTIEQRLAQHQSLVTPLTKLACGERRISSTRAPIEAVNPSRDLPSHGDGPRFAGGRPRRGS